MDEVSKQILEIVTSMQETMVTRVEFDTVKNDIAEIKDNVSQLRTDSSHAFQSLEGIDEQLSDVRGFAKEIDGLSDRLNIVEGKLDIPPKIIA